MFITLTDRFTEGMPKVRINTDHVVTYSPSSGQGGTTICLIGRSAIRVSESPDEVSKLIEGARQKDH